MSTVIKRDKKQKGTGKTPPFHMRIVPELKEQFDNEASNDGVSLANWLKELGRTELKRRGIEPKG
ncbi:toxin-antitoxin system HicB family antitoxin [Escherichia coli]|nr:toxin-antitoxin system HicB family antitoxin [Escherichia coli]